MFVGMDQVARADDYAAHFYRPAKIEQMHISMGDTDSTGEKMKAERANLIHIAHMTIGQHPDAAKPPMDIRHHLTEECPHSRRLVHVLQNDDARLRNFQDLFPRF